MSHDASAVEPRQGEPWESAHVDDVGRQTRGRADGIVVSEFDVGADASSNHLVARCRP